MPDPLLPTALSVPCPKRWCRARRGDRCVTNTAEHVYHVERIRAGLEREFPDIENPQRKETETA